MHVPNQALTWRRVQIPTVEDILQKVKGTAIFTEVDLSQGYMLAEESRHTAFHHTDSPFNHRSLPLGRILPWSYQADYQTCPKLWEHIRQHLVMVPRHGWTHQTTGSATWNSSSQWHYPKLPKCCFEVPEINVFGHIVSGQGIRPNNKKTEAIANAPQPKCASEVWSFLGLTNYCSQYVPDYSSITYPLRKLTRTNSTFLLGKEQEQSFQRLKQALASPQVLAHYSLTAPTQFLVDALPWALGAVLLQQQTDSSYRPIA